MTDPRNPAIPGIPVTNQTNYPPVASQESEPAESGKTDKIGNTEVSEAENTETPNGNDVISGSDGSECVQDFLQHIFGSEFDKFRQDWQIRKAANNEQSS